MLRTLRSQSLIRVLNFEPGRLILTKRIISLKLLESVSSLDFRLQMSDFGFQTLISDLEIQTSKISAFRNLNRGN